MESRCEKTRITREAETKLNMGAGDGSKLDQSTRFEKTPTWNLQSDNPIET